MVEDEDWVEMDTVLVDCSTSSEGAEGGGGVGGRGMAPIARLPPLPEDFEVSILHTTHTSTRNNYVYKRTVRVNSYNLYVDEKRGARIVYYVLSLRFRLR